MSASTTQHGYTIKEAAALTGLPASTLRYYETIGVIAPVSRGASRAPRLRRGRPRPVRYRFVIDTATLT